MKAGAYAISVEGQIILTRRELAVLNHICSYNLTEALKGCVSSHYEGGVTLDEMIKIMSDLQAKTGELMARIQNSKAQLFGSTAVNVPAVISDNNL